MKAWVQAAIERGKAAWEWFRRTRVGRMNDRYNITNGALLAGGVAYAGLFSAFALLAIGVTIFMGTLGNDPVLRDAVVHAVNEALPGVLSVREGDGGIFRVDDLILSPALTLASTIAVITLFFSGLAVMAQLGTAVRAMFGIVEPMGSAVILKLRDIGGFVILALAVVTTASLSVLAGVAGQWATAELGLDGSAVAILVRGLTLLGAFAVDTLVFAGIMRLVAGARPPRKDLWVGSAIGAVIAGAIRLLGAGVVGGERNNPLFASFAALLILLLWINLMARIMLYVAAWTANPPTPAPLEVTPKEIHYRDRPNYVTQSAPATLRWDHDPRTGAILPSEAHRPEREAQERAAHERERELSAALDAALQRPGTWVGRRRAARAARAAARAERAHPGP